MDPHSGLTEMLCLLQISLHRSSSVVCVCAMRSDDDIANIALSVITHGNYSVVANQTRQRRALHQVTGAPFIRPAATRFLLKSKQQLGPGPDRLGLGLGAKGHGPGRIGFGLGVTLSGGSVGGVLHGHQK